MIIKKKTPRAIPTLVEADPDFWGDTRSNWLLPSVDWVVSCLMVVCDCSEVCVVVSETLRNY